MSKKIQPKGLTAKEARQAVLDFNYNTLATAVQVAADQGQVFIEKKMSKDLPAQLFILIRKSFEDAGYKITVTEDEIEGNTVKVQEVKISWA